MKYYLSSLFYPFRGEGKYRLFFVIPIMWLYVLASWGPFFGGIARFLILSYMACYLMKMLHASAEEDSNDEMCEFPGAENRELLHPYLRFVAVVLFSFAPVLIGEFYFKSNTWVIIGLSVLGLIYFPMAFLRVMLSENVMDLSPPGWWRSVKNIPCAYVGLVIFSFIVFLVIDELLSKAYGLFNVVEFVAAPLIFLILAVCMNMLGKFYRKHEEKIEW